LKYLEEAVGRGILSDPMPFILAHRRRRESVFFNNFNGRVAELS
jgi:hypothetical protein